MSESNGRYAELVRQGYDAWNEGDRKWVRAHMTPDVVWTPPQDDPEVTPHIGVEAIERFWEQWRAAVGQLRFEILELVDAGSEVVVHARRSGKGVHSGLEVSDEVVQIFSFNEEGRCHSVLEFYDFNEAVRSIGLDPDAVRGPGAASSR